MAKVASSLQLTAILMLLLLEITFGQPPYLAGYRNDGLGDNTFSPGTHNEKREQSSAGKAKNELQTGQLEKQLKYYIWTIYTRRHKPERCCQPAECREERIGYNWNKLSRSRMSLAETYHEPRMDTAYRDCKVKTKRPTTAHAVRKNVSITTGASYMETEVSLRLLWKKKKI
ncbi:hypothetical protein D918_06417 [Trichuris suis]|nr:hypothetical protein D918_06417 [Trichuris suis]